MLTEAAAKSAGRTGAIYLGELTQLVGPAPTSELGDLINGEVPLASLERHRYIYDSPYYRGLLRKANFTNPAALVSSGERIEIQHFLATVLRRTTLGSMTCIGVGEDICQTDRHQHRQPVFLVEFDSTPIPDTLLLLPARD